MLSRVADSLYWLSLNMERAENITKLLSVRLVSILENNNPKIEREDNWGDLVMISGDITHFYQVYSECNRSNVIQYLAFQKENANSINSCISIVRENAKAIREIIPIELWEVINDLYLKIRTFPIKGVTIEQLNDFFQMILEKSFQYQGIITGLMPRGESYSFIMFGKHLERLRKLTRTLDVYYHKKISARDNKDSVNYHYWSAVLNSLGGYESYLQKYHAFIEPLQVVNYLVFDETLPRSATFNVKRLLYAFGKLEKDGVNSYTEGLHNKLTELLDEVSYESLDQISISIHNYFQRLQQLCDDVGIAIMDTYYLGEIKSL
ncbi:alpha-E domain-containing protein [Halalkalibacter kiskunsagensis]|uniref:Alpha-E domain-containing protein n=1 Tax=Halalkalibacter kiskunsagensis TaxID=1548599 RepID=A0ABV6KCV2_9BACI